MKVDCESWLMDLDCMALGQEIQDDANMIYLCGIFCQKQLGYKILILQKWCRKCQVINILASFKDM